MHASSVLTVFNTFKNKKDLSEVEKRVLSNQAVISTLAVPLTSTRSNFTPSNLAIENDQK